MPGDQLIEALTNRWWTLNQLKVLLFPAMTAVELRHELGLLDKSGRLLMVNTREGMAYKLRPQPVGLA